jgi:hypothetical protein
VSGTDVLLNVATAGRLFHASDGTSFADIVIDDHRETWPLRSKRFGAWLRQQYYERTWVAPSPAALNAALNVLEAQAQFDGPQRKRAMPIARDVVINPVRHCWSLIELPGWWQQPHARHRRHDQCEDDQDPEDDGGLRRHGSHLSSSAQG